MSTHSSSRPVHLIPPPVFDGTNYATWRRRLEEHFLYLAGRCGGNPDLWPDIVRKPVNSIHRDSCLKTGWAPITKALLLNALSKGEAAKVENCEYASDIWYKLQAIYGNPHVTRASLALLESQFDRFIMKPNETISGMHSRLMETVITPMVDLGRVVTEREQVDKILSILPRKFERDLSASKEENDVNAMTSAELVGFLISCEIMFRVNESESKDSVDNEGETVKSEGEIK